MEDNNEKRSAEQKNLSKLSKLSRRRWSKEEVDYLKENFGLRKISDIAKHLNRTETAITLKVKRLGLGYSRSLGGKLTSGELAQLLHVDRNTVKGWIELHQLPATRRITYKKRKHILISSTDFWEWAENNKGRVDFSKIEKNAIPPEPYWVAKERLFPTFKKRVYQQWTTKEDLLVLRYIEEKLSYQEIGERLGRSAQSIEKRYRRIKLNPFQSQSINNIVKEKSKKDTDK